MEVTELHGTSKRTRSENVRRENMKRIEQKASKNLLVNACKSHARNFPET